MCPHYTLQAATQREGRRVAGADAKHSGGCSGFLPPTTRGSYTSVVPLASPRPGSSSKVSQKHLRVTELKMRRAQTSGHLSSTCGPSWPELYCHCRAESKLRTLGAQFLHTSILSGGMTCLLPSLSLVGSSGAGIADPKPVFSPRCPPASPHKICLYIRECLPG